MVEPPPVLPSNFRTTYVCVAEVPAHGEANAHVCSSSLDPARPPWPAIKACREPVIGNFTRNVAPHPGPSLCAVIVPPCASARCFAIERPRPGPRLLA